jgi:cation diffusion facilitator CzcD-associated flavoprotein CzcO
MTTTDALVIGAGPHGLSIAAHLRDLGIEHSVVGRTMDTWRSHMPQGMYLKSEPYGSWMATPRAGIDLAGYCRAKGLEHVDRVGPLSLERFMGYADWYAQQLVPEVRDETVTEVTPVDGGFRVSFAAAAPVTARRVIVATGVLPYAHIPAPLAGLPADLVTHTSDHQLLDKFIGRKVAVIGSGQSALETAALLHEIGAQVQIIARKDRFQWPDPNPEHLGPLGQLRRPVTKLCEGWPCVVWNSPAMYRRLPEDTRVWLARRVLGPMGSWWLKDRVEGVVEALHSHHVREATVQGSGVRLVLDGPRQTSVDVDHVVCGTGFPIDLARLPFLPESLLARITKVQGYPAVSRAGESSVPGLYFVGAPSTPSLGVSARFIAGTHTIARVLSQSVARRLAAR